MAFAVPLRSHSANNILAALGVQSQPFDCAISLRYSQNSIHKLSSNGCWIAVGIKTVAASMAFFSRCSRFDCRFCDGETAERGGVYEWGMEGVRGRGGVEGRENEGGRGREEGEGVKSDSLFSAEFCGIFFLFAFLSLSAARLLSADSSIKTVEDELTLTKAKTTR